MVYKGSFDDLKISMCFIPQFVFDETFTFQIVIQSHTLMYSILNERAFAIFSKFTSIICNN